MKIAFLSQYFHPETFSNNQIARDLAARGHEVHVVCCVPNYPSGTFFAGYSNRARREEVWEGVAIHRAWTVPRGRSALSLIANYLTYPLAAIWTMMRRMPGARTFRSSPCPRRSCRRSPGSFCAGAPTHAACCGSRTSGRKAWPSRWA